MGNDNSGDSSMSTNSIATHAPMRGAIPDAEQFAAPLPISTHAPHTGSDMSRMRRAWFVVIF